MNRNIDILLWSDDVVSRTIKNVLQKYTDITLFEQKTTFTGFFPDLVVITDSDVQNALKSRLDAVSVYPDAKILYVKRSIDSVILGIATLVGFDGLLHTNIHGCDLYRICHSLAESPKVEIQARKRSNLIIQTSKNIATEQFTLRQLAILCLLTRNLDYNTISRLLCTTTGDVYIAEGVICSKLRIPREELKSYKMLCKYGSVEQGIKHKFYKIEPVMRRPGYFLVPRFYTEKPNK